MVSELRLYDGGDLAFLKDESRLLKLLHHPPPSERP